MRNTDQNRVNMLNAVFGTLNDPKYKDVWKDHEAFAEGVEAVSDALTAIGAQVEIAQGNPGARDAKEQTRQALRTSVLEVIGAVRAYAAVSADLELAAKVDYSASEVTAGKTSDVVARCKTIWSTANEIVDALGKYGITAAKLTALKKKIDAFDGVKSAPRQNRVTKSAAAQLLPQIVRSAVAVVRDQLDGLLVQFKEANPNFYEAYFAARVVVDNRASRTDKAAANTVPLPSVDVGAVPLAKAA